MEKKFDVIIIGSGLTGGLAADHFTRQGKEVCIIERGGDYFPYTDDQWNTKFVKNVWSEEHINVQGSSRWVTVSQDDPYERVEIKTKNSEPAFLYNMKFGVGGSGAVWSGTAFRFKPNDFKLRSLYGVGEDWPVTYEELEPWYGKAENELGVSGADPFKLWPRQTPYPMPAFRQSYLDSVFDKYLGKAFPLMPVPAAVASKKYKGRGPCVGARSCVPFCPTEARYHPVQNHLGDALARKNCSLLKRSVVIGLNIDEKTDRINSVTVLPEHHPSFEVSGDIFILAANTIENTRLLLHSANKRFPEGLANRHGLVGKYFMSTGAFVWLLEFPEFTYPFRGRPITSVCAKYSDGKHRSTISAFLLEVWNIIWTHGGLYRYVDILVNDGHWGGTLVKKAEDQLRRTNITAPFEILPNRNNTISLDKNDKDHFGIPLPVSNIKWGTYEEGVKDFVEYAMRETAPEVNFEPFGFGINGNHPFGTYRMGNNPKEGVVDHNLKSFDHDNLYILGGGSFVTSTCFNPTLTIAALTLKCLDSIKL